ncbi:MAG: type II toxin-antitoxin system PemK/MazF family toxin [Coxiellaceae bacterium]|nr:MAG: type II toxin-antitoxin system PemK/MazF family toxin [Coxiellaceae bacterium]
MFQNNVLIKEINNNCNPIKGEVYWAITSATDPKLTRPVLIIKAMNEKAGDFLVVSLTSDVPAHVNNNMIVKIGEERSRIQPSFHQVIHKSMLLNKCAEVPENVVQRIKKSLNN